MSVSRKRRWPLYFAGSLIFVFFGLFLVIFYRLEAFKEPLLSFLKGQVQGDIQISQVHLSFLPPGLLLKEVKLFAPGDSEASASIEKLKLNFKLVPLLQGNREARVYIRKPLLRMVLGTDGRNNFEKIFEALFANSALDEPESWKNFKVTQLEVQDAHFVSSEARNASPTEIQNLGVEADEIHFSSPEGPAHLRIHFELPRISRKRVNISSDLVLDSAQSLLRLQNGKAEWASAEMEVGGNILLPNPQRKNMEWALEFSVKNLNLEKFSKALKKNLNLNGDLTWEGKITGTAFNPLLRLNFEANHFRVLGKEISKLEGEVIKKDKVVEISKAHFNIFGGAVDLTGTLLPEGRVSGNFNLYFQGLNLSEMIEKASWAKISGELILKESDLEDPRSLLGEGNIVGGPFPLPILDLKDKMKIASLMSEGTLSPKIMNLDFLSMSSNVIGRQIDQLSAHLTISGDDTSLSPFRLSNSYFSAVGSGVLQKRRNIKASGLAILSGAVTTLLFPDQNFRSALTAGKGLLELPFHVNGTLENPEISIDAAYLKELLAKIAAANLKLLLLGNEKPAELFNALKGISLGNAESAKPSPKKYPLKPKNFEQFLFGK